MAFPHLSLGSGAIKGWDRRNHFYFQMLQSLASHFGFDLEAPFEQLPPSAQDVVLYGSGKEKISFAYLDRARPDAHARARRSRASSRTSSGVTARPTRSRCKEELAKYLNTKPCPACDGTRLRREARHVRDRRHARIYEISALPLKDAQQFFEQLALDGRRQAIAEKIVREIANRLQFLVNVGLDYLSLDRAADTLSGGEAQRIRLASQIGSGLTGVMYVLDEPSIGLHQRDNGRLLDTLGRLRDIGNSVIVVEHDHDAIMTADYVVDMGPGAGEHGGHIVAEGTPQEVSANPASLTGQYLSGKRSIALPKRRTPIDRSRLLKLEGRERQQPQAGRPRPAGGPLHVRHRRLRFGQVHPHQRHAVCGGRPPPLRQRRRAGTASRARRARTSSTRW